MKFLLAYLKQKFHFQKVYKLDLTLQELLYSFMIIFSQSIVPTESGNDFTRKGMNNNGRAPKKKTDSQPKLEIRTILRKAAITPPMEYPAIIVAIIRLRIPFGEYSLIKPITFGIMPPNPKPVIKRNIPNISGVGANPERSINRLKIATQIKIIFFRA